METALSFVNHSRLAWTDNVKTLTGATHNPNLLERVGDDTLWPWKHLPRTCLKLLRNPQVWTVAATGSALIANSYLFYPTKTHQLLKEAARAIKPLMIQAQPYIRFGGWVLTSSQILALGTRSLGRFQNNELMTKLEDWFKNGKKVAEDNG